MSEQKGIVLAFIAALISGISVFLNAYASKGMDALVLTALKNSGAAILLIGSIFALKEREALLKLGKNQWLWLISIGLIGGSIPFLMFFQGLSMVSAVKGSFLFRLLFIFSAVFAVLMLKEKPSRNVAYGAGIVLIGNFLLLGNENLFSIGFGELLVIGATVIWGFEYVLSKWAMNTKGIEPRFVAFGRMFFGTIFVFGYLASVNNLGLIATLSIAQFEMVLLLSAFLFVFLIGWYGALKFAKATTATAILTLGGPITAALNYLFLGKSPTAYEGFGLLLITLGIMTIVGWSQLEKVPSGAKSLVRGELTWTELK